MSHNFVSDCSLSKKQLVNNTVLKFTLNTEMELIRFS